MNLGAARERVRVARALPSLPRIADAFARGELSYAKVRALTRVATPETEERLLAVGRAGSADQVERIVRGWRRVDQMAEAREESRRHNGRALQVYQDADGMVMIRGRLTPEQGAVLMQALEAARETLYQRTSVAANVPEETSSMAQQQADALALLAETALHHGIDPGSAGERYQVVVHVDAPVLGDADARGQSVLDGGTRVSAEMSRRLACDATRVIMRHDADGRPVHEEGYQVERLSDGTLRFRRPNGWLLPDVSPSPAIPNDPIEALKERNEAAGLRLDGRTLCPTALWEHLDVGWAIDVLHPRAVGQRGALSSAGSVMASTPSK